MKRTKAKRLEVGTLSHGTLRTEDIYDALIYELRQLAPRRAKQIEAEWDVLTNEEREDGAENEILYEALYPTLEAFCPPFCYLGSHEGDGSDVGVWPSWDSLDEAVSEGEVWKDPDDGSKIPAGASFRMVVSDHGNVTLYYRNGREVWGLV